MARGHARAPSQNAYRGSIGRTQTQAVHVTGPKGDLIVATVHTAIDAVSDPELVERLYADDDRALNAILVDGAALRLAVPIVYHDPAAEVMVLVLGEAHRHRELDERIALLQRLRDDGAALPAYAKDFAVVFGATGLRAYLEGRAQAAVSQVGAQRSLDAAKDAERKLAAREDELVKAQADVARQRQELAAARSMLEHERGEQQRAQAELERMRAEQRARVIASVQAPAPGTQGQLHADGSVDVTMVTPTPAPLPQAPTAAPVPVAVAAAVAAAADVALDEQFTTSPHAKLDLPSEPGAPLPSATNGAAKPARAKKAAAAAKPAPAAPEPAPLPSILHSPPAAAHAPAPAADDDATVDISADPAHAARLAPEPEPEHRDLRDDSQPAVTGAIVPPGSDPLTTDTIDLGAAPHDTWLDFAATGVDSTFEVRDGHVRLALVVGDQVIRGLGGALDVRVLLHRMPTYPVVALVIGPPAALRVPSPSQLAIVTLDIGAELDHQVLAALGKGFELTVVPIHHGSPARGVKLVAPLADNVQYIVRAADDHLRELGDVEPSFQRARDAVLAPGFDVLGAQHAEAGEFRDDKLAQLQTAQQLRRAIAIARRFARPSREDYLVCTRGFPLQRWRDLRRHVLESAVAWGIWMGPELAQVAVSEGLARSRRDLVGKLDAAFDALRAHPTAYDIDADAAADNAKALAEEARALGVDLKHRGNGTNGHGIRAIASEDAPVVAGSISGEPVPALATSPDQLIAMLDDKRQRVAAAAELCDRGESRAAPAVVAAIKKMSRAEAVRILGKVVRLGPPAAPPLIENLRSSKAFLRHGSALALALLRTDEGTHAIIELLLEEPTEVWREVARALGQVGPAALMPLASTVGRLGDRMTPQIQERVAWAMAHVGVRGGRGALEQMAAGQSVMAPVAQQAVGLVDEAARDELSVRPGAELEPGVEVTVNHAFSRRFFESLEAADGPAVHEVDLSNPAELLDEADLIVEDDEAELDESDLIQT